MNDLSGQYLGRYHLTERLGEGGMAVVYKAYDTRLERDVAIKIIRSGAFPADALGEILKRFEREAKSLAKLSHPNIVKVYDYGEHEGEPYLVMEYLPGGTLRKMLGKPSPWRDSLHLILPVARGVAYAHQRGVLHRDIKPANVLLMDSGEPMLSDFGIAKLFGGEQATTLTGSGMAIGTPEYMAPEQWTGTTSQQSDLYSLAVVLYELVTGRKPYVADTPAEILIKQATEPLPSPRQFAADLPEAIEQVLFKALAKEPGDRFKDLNTFIHALENLESTPADFPRAFGTPKEKAPARHVVPTRTTPLKRISRASIGLLVGGTVLALVLWLSSSFVGKWFESAPDETTQPAIATQTLENVQVYETPTQKNADLATSTPTTVAEPTRAPGDVQISKIDGMAFHYIPAGTFIMGETANIMSAKCQESGSPPHGCGFDRFTDGEPVHKVYLDAYWMDETEVTNEKYQKCVKAGACRAPSTLSPYYKDERYGNYPVVFVSWNDANAYCAWADRRLPTEAEWEKAARGTDGRTYPWGEAFGTEYANYNTSPGDVTEVGSYEIGKSPYGLYDMAGNVWEMVADWYQENYYKTLGDNAVNPQGPASGQGHVRKGGGFLYNDIQSAQREEGGSDVSTNEMSFRCAVSEDSIGGQATTAQIESPEPETLPTEITDDTGVSMALVPAGEFTMGSDNGDNDEKPVHQVYLDAYYMDIYEVTNASYKACVDAGGCTPPKDSWTLENYYGISQFDDHPVISVDWYQANAHCEWRGARLPTEAQWEKAARGADGRTYPWGEEAGCDKANYLGCTADRTRVGSYESGKSPYGIYDLAGNVWEWVADWYASNYYIGSPASNPLGSGSGDHRVLRGGAWAYDVFNVRAANRHRNDPLVVSLSFGFRCAKDAP